MDRIINVPTSVITGFLGVGKTTAIRALVRQAPLGSRWAVVVNEFGEVGIDAAALDGGGLAVHEIPGGCICCTSGLALNVALVRILREVRPTRILIEPTGLAHPASVLDMLNAQAMSEAVRVRATITLIDPRHLTDERVRSSATWQDQVAVADVLVANKVDLSTAEDLARFDAFAQERWPEPLGVQKVSEGRIDPAWLDRDPYPRQPTRFTPAPHLTGAGTAAAEAVTSCGWTWPPHVRFDRRRLQAVLQQMVRSGPVMPAGVLRLKGLFRTQTGWLHIQADPDAVRSEPSGWRRDSRVEVIAPASPPVHWETVHAHLETARVAGTPNKTEDA
ncbi:MAG: GTP-binding protein [Myxococcota bacterium]